jgi:signal transduction histidine kinase
MAAAIAIGMGVGRSLSAPLFRLVQATQKLASGDLSVRVAQGRRDEVGALAAAFNHMAGRLQESYQELDDKNRETERLNRELVRDNTERRRAEEALRARTEEVKAMTQQLWQAAKLATMGELAASIAHELNNPLATVSLRVEALLAQVAAHDPKRRALEVVEQEVERMAHLIAGLLQFSRRGRGHVSTLDLQEELEKTLELVHYHLRNRGITVVREFAPGVLKILADCQQMRQLFLNLFTNAADAMPTGGTLTLRVWAEAQGSRGAEAPSREGAGEQGSRGAEAQGSQGVAPMRPSPPAPEQVVIEVADTGVGIAPEDLPKLSEPFFTTKPEGKGTGLGLAICRRIVQEHRGTLDFASEVGKGTTVRITVPTTNGANVTYLGDSET